MVKSFLVQLDKYSAVELMCPGHLAALKVTSGGVASGSSVGQLPEVPPVPPQVSPDATRDV
jgi:hypothetical protein